MEELLWGGMKEFILIQGVKRDYSPLFPTNPKPQPVSFARRVR